MNGVWIFDLDGTLADIEHRRPLVDNSLRDPRFRPQWRAFFEACDRDKPVYPVIEVFRALWHEGKILEIWSGRSAEVRAKTLHWLSEHVFRGVPADLWSDADHPQYVRLRMRPEGDYQSDVTLKESWLDSLVSEGLEPVAVFDDRKRLVEMWRRRGVLCFQCAEGNY
jgi:FMN phosphatase YigB (HAD superfamily)